VSRALKGFASGDSFVAEGLRPNIGVERAGAVVERDGAVVEREGSVVKKIGHDLARTNYSLERARREARAPI
jgi:single-strand DNA-binding protein